jgi:hypothetical protein
VFNRFQLRQIGFTLSETSKRMIAIHAGGKRRPIYQ